MPRLVLIVPGLLREGEDGSALREPLPYLAAVMERSEPFRTRSADVSGNLGFPPEVVRLAPGPALVSALGADPPERSLQFRLTLLSVVDGQIRRPEPPPSEAEAAEIAGHLARFNTRELTLLAGEGAEHALVWEGKGDFACVPADEAVGRPLAEVLPQADDERPLRNLLDASVNLLMELDLNARRLDEGKDPLNLLWPWGEGRRSAVPNLALRLGYPPVLETTDLHLRGIARLAGYRLGDRRRLGEAVRTDWPGLARRTLRGEGTVAYVPAPEDPDERRWFLRTMDERLIEPWRERLETLGGDLTVLAPATEEGIGLRWTSLASRHSLPFDERLLEERSVQLRPVFEAVGRGLTG